MVDPEEAARDHLSRIIADLSRPEAYPDPVDTIELEETHASAVFLTSDFVYKVKKPVDFGFLDFSTLERREFFAHEEVRLNQRLTRDVYLGVVPVVEVGGRLQLFGEGPVVEYAVKMRRLPDDRMLSALLAKGLAGEEIFAAVAERLSQFYGGAATGPGIDEWGTTAAVWRNIRENLDQTAPYLGTIVAPFQLQLIEEVSTRFLGQESECFAERAARGMIREGHGDLHLAHICIEGPNLFDLQIFDCIEFNPRLRCGDVAVDAAFLAMDLDYHGHRELARAFINHLSQELQDPDLARLVHFFSIYRAHVRAKVACFRSNELAPEMPEYLAVKREAERYFDLATSYIVEPEVPTMFLVGGLSGTGKSVVARRLARSLDATLVSSDVVRKELAGLPPETRVPVKYGTGIYTPEHTERTYETILERARGLLAEGRSVVLDATFLDSRWHEQAHEVASSTGADVLLIECRCPPAVVYERLERRARVASEPSDADWSVYQQQRERFGDTLVRVVEMPCIAINTDQSSSLILDTILSSLRLRQRL
ncbi:AAA family ATPase [Nitrolancea hollandica]|uniref:Uma3 n=1 Tax=Nitrolancea hollandica Lb TaxID=1129897 RepID=I4EHI1_9BACT|nr:bifunctional aminoglycoside phosphotransferase/ATP-binding protein [Nitrolancea hollandica]CCF84143.1 Uma3 [Nitrolancea hollandica Lb]